MENPVGQRHRPLLPDRPTTRRLTHRPVPVRPAARPDPRNPKESWYRPADQACATVPIPGRRSGKPRQRPHEITHPRIQAKARSKSSISAYSSASGWNMSGGLMPDRVHVNIHSRASLFASVIRRDATAATTQTGRNTPTSRRKPVVCAGRPARRFGPAACGRRIAARQHGEDGPGPARWWAPGRAARVVARSGGPGRSRCAMRCATAVTPTRWHKRC